jgi:hypothetical protein
MTWQLDATALSALLDARETTPLQLLEQAFARRGPRVIEGTELLAHLFHPDRFHWNGPPGAYQRLTLGSIPNPGTQP